MLALKQNKIKSNESWIINYNLHNTLPCDVIAIVDLYDKRDPRREKVNIRV